jgi:hypothetical protein
VARDARLTPINDDPGSQYSFKRDEIHPLWIHCKQNLIRSFIPMTKFSRLIRSEKRWKRQNHIPDDIWLQIGHVGRYQSLILEILFKQKSNCFKSFQQFLLASNEIWGKYWFRVGRFRTFHAFYMWKPWFEQKTISVCHAPSQCKVKFVLSDLPLESACLRKMKIADLAQIFTAYFSNKFNDKSKKKKINFF